MNPAADLLERPGAGPILALLDRVARRIPAEAMDELWVFPPRRQAEGESHVVVLSAFDNTPDRRRIITAHGLVRRSAFDNTPDRRRIITAHGLVRRDARGRPSLQETVTEHGSAPVTRVGHLIEGVLRRLDDQVAPGEPRAARIQGDARRWAELLSAIAEASPVL